VHTIGDRSIGMIVFKNIKIFKGKIPANCEDSDVGSLLLEEGLEIVFWDIKNLTTKTTLSLGKRIEKMTLKLPTGEGKYFRIYGDFDDKKDVCHMQGTLDMWGRIE
jgi:hypothetical protein